MEAINKLLASSLSSSRFLLSFPTKIQNTQTERERKKKFKQNGHSSSLTQASKHTQFPHKSFLYFSKKKRKFIRSFKNHRP
jgi:hypothetical protein